MSDPTDTWRENREPGWTEDIGYVLQNILQSHHYLTGVPGLKRPNDPGWNPCTCGWEGYWSDYEPHVADLLRAAVQDRLRLIRDEIHAIREDTP